MVAGNLSPSGVAGRGSDPVTSVAAATAATASRELSRAAVCCVGLVLILAPDFGFGCGTGSAAGGVLDGKRCRRGGRGRLRRGWWRSGAGFGQCCDGRRRFLGLRRLL